MSQSLTIAVTGGRNFNRKTVVWRTLDRLRPSLVVVGDASGADSLVRQWARSTGTPVQIFEADWKRYGRRAGPIRNRTMLEVGRPDMLLVCPGGAGTRNCEALAKQAGIPVLQLGATHVRSPQEREPTMRTEKNRYGIQLDVVRRTLQRSGAVVTSSMVYDRLNEITPQSLWESAHEEAMNGFRLGAIEDLLSYAATASHRQMAELRPLPLGHSKTAQQRDRIKEYNSLVERTQDAGLGL